MNWKVDSAEYVKGIAPQVRLVAHYEGVYL